MGITEMIPGVSSGTLALLMGIYNQFLGSIKGLVLKDFKRSFVFLLPLVIGMGIAIVALSGVITYLLDEHQVPTQWTFIGLVIGVVPMLLRVSKFQETFQARHYFVLVVGLALIIIIGMITPNETLSYTELEGFQYVKLFFAGMLATMTMLLPGISGSLVLLIFGYYYVVFESISEVKSFNLEALPILLIVGTGMVLGLFVGSVGITFFFKKYPFLTYAFIIGLIVGSVYAIYPGLPTTPAMWAWTVVMALVGFVISYILGLAGEKEQRAQDRKIKRGVDVV